MAAEISFKWDSSELQVFRSRAVEKALTRALRLAGNAAAREMLKKSVAGMLRRKYLREEFIRRGIKLKPMPGARASIAELVWEETISGKAIPLAEFPHVQTKRGVAFRINRGSPKQEIKSAFIRERAGKDVVFRRAGLPHHQVKRLPLEQKFSARLSDTMESDPSFIPEVQEATLTKFNSAFERGLQRELQKLRSKGDL